MKRMSGLVVACVVFGLGCGVTQTGKPGTAAQRTKLTEAREIQGYPCAKGYAMVYPSGKLASCSVSRETAFGEALVPAGSIIGLESTGKPKGAMMAHNTVIAGVRCGGGNWPLGPSEGAFDGVLSQREAGAVLARRRPERAGGPVHDRGIHRIVRRWSAAWRRGEFL